MTPKKRRRADSKASRQRTSESKSPPRHNASRSDLDESRSTFVKAGEPLGYERRLRKRRAWPPNKIERKGEHRVTATPNIVVPTGLFDLGNRPITPEQADNSTAITIVDTLGNPIEQPASGGTYRIRCLIRNRGAIGAYGGIAVFYVASAAALDAAVSNPTNAVPTLGVRGFSALPGQALVVECRQVWQPVTDTEAQSSILVHGFDPFSDPLRYPFDAQRDCHVGRRDPIPNFSGVWNGIESANQIHQTPTLIRMVITQSGLNVSVGIYSQIGGQLPSTPQDSASAAVTGGQVQLAITEFWGPQHTPFTNNQWILSLPSPDVLHFDHYRQFIMPGDTRPDTLTHGDLHRI